MFMLGGYPELQSNPVTNLVHHVVDPDVALAMCRIVKNHAAFKDGEWRDYFSTDTAGDLTDNSGLKGGCVYYYHLGPDGPADYSVAKKFGAFTHASDPPRRWLRTAERTRRHDEMSILCQQRYVFQLFVSMYCLFQFFVLHYLVNKGGHRSINIKCLLPPL